MSKHTPGPWVAQLVPTSAGSGYTFKPMRACLYVDGMAAHNAKDSEWDEAHANARLIASAPDLLEALKIMTAHYCNLVRSGDAGNWESDAEQEVMTAKAAIAKATGND